MYDPNTNTLVCISSGGPATNVTWKVSGEPLVFSESTYRQTQKIVSTANSTTETSLHFPNSSIESYIYNTTYECIVSNTRGNDSSLVSLEGKRKFDSFGSTIAAIINISCV